MVIRHFALSTFLASAIFVLLMLPPQNFGGPSSFSGVALEWVVHVILFMSFTLALIIAFKKQPSNRIRQNAILFSIILGVGYSAFTEMAQKWADIGRTADVQDFLFDVVGCFTAILVFRLIFGKEFRYY